MVQPNHLRVPLLPTSAYSRSDSLAIDSVRSAKARRIRDQAWARYDRRRRACLQVVGYCRAKWPERRPGLMFRISLAHLRAAGFWHGSPRHARGARIYFEDMVHLEEQALMLCTRLDHMAAP